MEKVVTIIFILVTAVSFGQSVQIDTFKLKESVRFKDIQSSEMNFPIIRSGKKVIDSLINTDLLRRFTNNENFSLQTDSVLSEWASNQIIYLNFEVSYNINGILSLNISAEGCGSYCTFWTDYFNYSTTSGEWLDVSEIIDTSGNFKKHIYKDKEKQYESQKKSLIELTGDPDGGLNQDDYEIALNYYNECDSTFNLEKYALYPRYIQIIETCWLPHFMRPYTPNIELKYHYRRIKNDLKLKELKLHHSKSR